MRAARLGAISSSNTVRRFLLKAEETNSILKQSFNIGKPGSCGPDHLEEKLCQRRTHKGGLAFAAQEERRRVTRILVFVNLNLARYG